MEEEAQWWLWSEDVWGGIVGGGILGLLRLYASLISIYNSGTSTPRYGRLVGTHVLITAFYAFLGGIFCFAYKGFGDGLMDGLGAVAIFAALGGVALPALTHWNQSAQGNAPVQGNTAMQGNAAAQGNASGTAS